MADTETVDEYGRDYRCITGEPLPGTFAVLGGRNAEIHHVHDIVGGGFPTPADALRYIEENFTPREQLRHELHVMKEYEPLGDDRVFKAR